MRSFSAHHACSVQVVEEFVEDLDESVVSVVCGAEFEEFVDGVDGLVPVVCEHVLEFLSCLFASLVRSSSGVSGSLYRLVASVAVVSG